MNLFATLLTRPRLLTAALSTGAFAVLACHPTLARSVGADVWNVPALEEKMRSETDESERLSAEGAATMKRIAMKEAVVHELIAGRASLAEATDRFVELNAGRAPALDSIRATCPGDTDREKTAHNVISYALGRVSSEARAALSHRLGAELQQLLAAGGDR